MLPWCKFIEEILENATVHFFRTSLVEEIDPKMTCYNCRQALTTFSPISLVLGPQSL